MKKEVVKIIYEWWGNANIENRSWVAVLPDQSALDYGTVKQLKRVCIEDGYDYEVIRHHRNGTKTILEKSYD